jgi:A/G-specific adenine glycosylase
MSSAKKPSSSVKKHAKAAGLQAALLSWFDRHRRVLPWRARRGQRPDPYHVWLSEIMLQQTTVVTVGPYFEKFLKKWPTVQKLAAASQDDVLTAWAGLGYYARARNLHKCAKVVAAEHNGRFPDTVEALRALPGIGPYTAGAVASIAFDVPAVAVDGNVERVVSRFFAIEAPLPLSKETIRAKAAELAEGVVRPGDFTQAFMELGATICTPRNPKCGQCPWREDCRGRIKGIAEDLPRKMPKAAKPIRYGKVYWLTDGKGRFLIHKRGGQGLYEGMFQLPTTDWIEDRSAADKLPQPFEKQVKTQPLKETVRHSLTHFDLVLEIYAGALPSTGKTALKSLSAALWIYPENIGDYGLPTLMKKAIRLCLGRDVS